MNHQAQPEDIKYLCRLCGSKTTPINRMEIFDSIGSSLNINSKISYCIEINIRESDTLPKVLCTNCVSNVELFYRFKIESHKTEDLLQNLSDSSSFSHHMLGDSFQNNSSDSSQYDSILEPEVSIKTKKSKNSKLTTKKNTKIIKKKAGSKTDYPCKYCKTNFKTYIELLKHVKQMHKNAIKNKKLSIPKRTYTKRSNSNSSYFKCDFCLKDFKTRKQIVRHMEVHVFQPILCSYCNKTFKRKHELKHHIKRHEKSYDHICDYCGKGFIGKSSFIVHIRTKHTKEYPFECKMCDKKFARQHELTRHISYSHENNSTFICEICGKSLKDPHYLKQHKEKHAIPIEDRRKFKCTICDATYTNTKSVKRHMLTHTGEMPYACKLCEKRYRDRSGLKTHMIVHSGEKKFVCNVCGKAFALKVNLDVHNYIHTGERPYKCNFCFKTFTQNSSLNLHRKKSCPGIHVSQQQQQSSSSSLIVL